MKADTKITLHKTHVQCESLFLLMVLKPLGYSMSLKIMSFLKERRASCNFPLFVFPCQLNTVQQWSSYFSDKTKSQKSLCWQVCLNSSAWRGLGRFDGKRRREHSCLSILPPFSHIANTHWKKGSLNFVWPFTYYQTHNVSIKLVRWVILMNRCSSLTRTFS